MLRLFERTVDTRRGYFQGVRSLYNVLRVEKLAELPADPPQLINVGTTVLIEVKP
jgi:hypothetical protein